MGELQIKNNMGHYYIVSDYIAERNEEYLIKMITENNLKWHLPCKISYEGSNKILLFDITNMISIEREYENRYLEFDELKEVFESINYAFSVGNNYLLDQKYYVLNPKYIFKDMESNEIRLLYIPGYNSCDANRYYPLADFLLQRVNRKCDSCIQTTYQFYRMTKADTFSISMFLNIIDKEQLIHKRPEIRIEEDIKIVEEETEEESNDEKVVYLLPSVLTGVAILAVLAYLLWLKKTYYAVYSLAIAFMLCAVSVMLWIKELVLIIKHKKENEYKEACEESSVEKYWEDEDTILIDDEKVNNDSSEAEGILRLEWMEQNRPQKFIVNTFPVIIGKMNEEVDCKIDDISISRLHAKIVKRNNGIYIFDLNSTNGTCVNGRKLNPGEETMVMSSSEILLGSVALKLAY